MSDNLFFFGSLGIWVIIGIIFILYRIKSERPKNFIFFFLLNIVIATIYSYVWFTQIAKDGVSEMAGILLYGIAAIILISIETIICNIKGSSQGIDLNK
jgi:hypothetical protein